MDRFTPLDLSQDGEQEWPIITQNGYFIGLVKLNVWQDTVIVTYVMNDPATIVTKEVLFLHDEAMSVTGPDLADEAQTLKFGEVIPLNGATEKVLNVRLTVNFDSDNQENKSFSDNGIYIDGVTKNPDLLQDMTLVLTGAAEVMTLP